MDVPTLTQEEKDKIQSLLDQGKKVGYATGVWDLFHIGHLNILKQAKSRCDFLIVGVSTDENCYSYKKKNPVVPFDERKEIIESVKHVDLVVPQFSMDKVKAWEELRFNLLFHGNDLKYEFEDDLNSKGAEVVYLNYTKGVSSSKRSKIREERGLK